MEIVTSDAAPLLTRLVKGYVSFLTRFRVAVALFWLCVFGISCVFGPKLATADSNNSFTSPPNSPSAIADSLMAELFPSVAGAASIVLVIQSLQTQNCTSSALATFESAYNTSAYGYSAVVPVSVSGYFSALQVSAEMAAGFISADARTTTMSITPPGMPASTANLNYAAYLKAEVSKIVTDQGLAANYSFTLTGQAAFSQDVSNAIAADTSRLDSIVLPIAFVIMAMFVKSLRLLIVPFLCIPTTILLSLALVYGLTKSMAVPSFESSFLLSILLALSIDYSLFLLRRYREALDTGYSHNSSVVIMLLSAGRTVTISGVMLMVCLFSLAGLKFPTLVATGISGGLAMIAIITVHLSICPLLMVSFPTFFAKSAEHSFLWPPTEWVKPEFPLWVWIRSKRANITSEASSAGPINVRVHDSAAPEDTEHAIVSTLNSESEPSTKLQHSKLTLSLWWRAADKLLRWPFNLLAIVVIVCLTIPFYLHTTQMKITVVLNEVLPRGTSSTKGLDELTSAFGWGQAFPLQLIMVPPSGTSAYSDAAFQGFATIITALATAPGITQFNVSMDLETAAFTHGSAVSFSAMSSCVANPSSSPSCPSLLSLKSTYLSSDNSAMYASINTFFDTSSLFGHDWVQSLRSAMTQQSESTGYKLYLAGSGADGVDNVNGVYQIYPYLIGVPIAIVFVLVLIAFKSVLNAIRTVLTVGLTMCWIFGFVSAIYNPSLAWMAWTSAACFQSLDGMFWLSPVLGFAVILGISLDYDVFLLVRIREHRMEGYDNRTAIMMGLTTTGSIITVAGVIMTVAFSSLLAASTPLLNIIGSYLVWAVLFDTFIIRTILVPCALHLMGDLAWWPIKPPTPSKSIV